MKGGSISKSNAFPTEDPSMVCGVVRESASGNDNGNTNNNNTGNNNGNGKPISEVGFPGGQFRFGRSYVDSVKDYSNVDYITIWMGTIDSNGNTNFNYVRLCRLKFLF
jgi:hypothetical protein